MASKKTKKKTSKRVRALTIEEVATLFPDKRPAVICVKRDDGARLYGAFWTHAYLTRAGEVGGLGVASPAQTFINDSPGVALADLVRSELTLAREDAKLRRDRAEEAQKQLEALESKIVVIDRIRRLGSQ